MDEVLHNVVLAIWCNLLDPCWCTGHAGDQDSIGFLVLAGTVSGWCSFFFFFLWWFILLISWSHGWGDAFNSRCRSVRASGFFITWSASWKFCRFCDHVCWCGLFIQLNVIPVTMKEWKWGMEVVLLCGMHMCAGDAVIMLCRCLCLWKPVCWWLESRCSCWVNGAVLHCWD